MRNIKLTLSYDGTNFHGFQMQKNAHTIEAELTQAISKLTKENIKIIGCGRTDAGVHAMEYIVGFRTNTTIPINKLPIAINANICDAISINAAEVMHDHFHARYDIVRKTYIYRLQNSQYRNPFEERYCYRYGEPLDISAMQQACTYFIGTHDFASHKSLGTKTTSDVRTIYDCKITKIGDMIEMEITADGFLYNMARTIAGTLLFCGNGKINPLGIPQILINKDRKNAGPTLPAKGLFMKKTIYKGDA